MNGDERLFELVQQWEQAVESGQEITVSQLDPNAQPIVTAVFWHEDLEDLDRLRQTAENNIRLRIQRETWKSI